MPGLRPEEVHEDLPFRQVNCIVDKREMGREREEKTGLFLEEEG